MPIVVGVSFKKAGKIYYFGLNGLDIKEGDHVVTVTARGSKIGLVVNEPKEVTEDEIIGTLKDVERVATPADLVKDAQHRIREQEALKICAEKIANHSLPMELLDAEISFDETMITFSFAADGRIDFRELVKDVAGALKLKVQLLQIGVRDKAKLVGGYGSCGQPLCCAQFLTNFEPVSMKMAKDQSLFLNPVKFSGCCGKLMCCLKYEHQYYAESQRILPNPGTCVETENGIAKIKDYNVISNMVILENEDGTVFTIPIAKANIEGACKKHGCKKGACNEGCHKVSKDELEYLGVFSNVAKIEEDILINSPAYDDGKSISFEALDSLLDENDIKEKPANKPKDNKYKKPFNKNIGGNTKGNFNRNNNNNNNNKENVAPETNNVTPKPFVKNDKPIENQNKPKIQPKPFKLDIKKEFSDLGITFRDVDEPAKDTVQRTSKPHVKHHEHKKKKEK